MTTPIKTINNTNNITTEMAGETANISDLPYEKIARIFNDLKSKTTIDDYKWFTSLAITCSTMYNVFIAHIKKPNNTSFMKALFQDANVKYLSCGFALSEAAQELDRAAKKYSKKLTKHGAHKFSFRLKDFMHLTSLEQFFGKILGLLPFNTSQTLKIKKAQEFLTTAHTKYRSLIEKTKIAQVNLEKIVAEALNAGIKL
jgi:hypothetical protein